MTGQRGPDHEPGEEKRHRIGAMMPLVYRQLHRLAARALKGERPGHTLQPTALVNEVYLKFERQQELSFENRTHFLALAATAMRQVLVDHARARRASKRGGGIVMVTLDEAAGLAAADGQDVLALHDALERLAALDPDEARIVEMMFFGGLTQVEIASHLGRSERWVRDQWLHAKAWLRRELSGP